MRAAIRSFKLKPAAGVVTVGAVREVAAGPGDMAGGGREAGATIEPSEVAGNVATFDAASRSLRLNAEIAEIDTGARANAGAGAATETGIAVSFEADFLAARRSFKLKAAEAAAATSSES